MGSSKSLGTDGFTAEFYKFFWDTMKHDVMAMVLEFFSSGIINASLNETYICLIPKKIDPKSVADYHPISLIYCAYKITTWVLSSRLKHILLSVIPDN